MWTTSVKLIIAVLILGATMAERCVNAEYKLKFDPRREDQQNINDNIVQHLWSSFYKMCPKAVMFTGFPKTIKDKHWPHGLW